MTSPQSGFFIGRVLIPGRVLMAPLAGITNGPFRIVAAEAGCLAFWTEMITAEGLVRRRPEIMALLPDRDEPHPVAVQLFGADPDTLAEAAAMVEEAGADMVDINMACPVSRLARIGAGAALMKDPPKTALLVKAVKDRVRLPVTVKIRAGWDAQRLNALEVARAAAAEGASAVLFHGRTRAQGFSGRADHRLAGPLVAAVSIPVIVSGDICSPEQALSVLSESGAAGIMIGRAAVGNPWIFGEVERYLSDGSRALTSTLDERQRTILRHLDLLERKFGPRRSVSLFRPHLVGYLKGRADASRWRRELLGERDSENLRRRLREAF